MEKARDYYSNKLLIAQEVKGIYQQTISAIDKKFICPECGEYVAFVSGNKKKPYFRHCNSNEYTKNCDFRTQTQTYSSIYEKLGLPMYIKKVGENYYELFIGFYKLEEYILKLAEDLDCNVDITKAGENEEQIETYSINSNRFSINSTSLIRVDFISFRYHLKYNSTRVGKYLLERWGNNIEGILDSGTLFEFNENGGRKIRINDEITTNTDYYLIAKRGLFHINGVIVEKIGTVTSEKINVFKINFSYNSEIEFNILREICRDKFKVSLLKKITEVIPIWPPSVKEDNRYRFFDTNLNAKFILSTEEKDSKIYLHGVDEDTIEITGIKLDEKKQFFSFNVKKEENSIAINEKYRAISMFVLRYKGIIKEFQPEFNIYDDKENIIETGIYNEIPKKFIKIYANSKFKIIHYRKNKIYREYIIENKNGIRIEEIKYNDEIIAVIGLNRVKLLKYIIKKKEVINQIEESELYKKLLSFKENYVIPSPILKKAIIKFNKDIKIKKILLKFLHDNRIPKNVEELLKIII